MCQKFHTILLRVICFKNKQWPYQWSSRTPETSPGKMIEIRRIETKSYNRCYLFKSNALDGHCLFFKEMTLNKMVWNFWHQFLIRFSMLFQMVPFILLCMVAHLTITWLVETIPTANQRALCWWFLKLPWREKRKVPSERAMKIESETGVKSDTPFCLRLPIEKTNSGVSSLWHHSPEIS